MNHDFFSFSLCEESPGKPNPRKGGKTKLEMKNIASQILLNEVPEDAVNFFKRLKA